jgi:hypothetical protein
MRAPEWQSPVRYRFFEEPHVIREQYTNVVCANQKIVIPESENKPNEPDKRQGKRAECCSLG